MDHTGGGYLGTNTGLAATLLLGLRTPLWWGPRAR